MAAVSGPEWNRLSEPVGRAARTTFLVVPPFGAREPFPLPARIAINGYGTIGKRVADAVALQDDMRLAGVAKTKPDFEAKIAVQKGFSVFAANKDSLAKFEKAGIRAAGTVEDLVREADLVVDCTPEQSGYRPLYEKAGVKAIWQGGEEHSLTNLSFNAAANYADCFGASFVRVPSCNTTGLIRTLYPLDAHFGVDRVLALMVRRATDPGDSKRGPINAIEPELDMPSHHGPDVQSVLPKMNIHTIAVKVPTTIMHLHTVTVDLKKTADTAQVLDVWKRFPRIAFVAGAEGVKSTAQVMEMARDLSRNRADLYEVAVWRDGVHVVDGKRLYYFQAVHQESDVVPENVDAIRALLELEKDGHRSMEKTDRSLGIGLAK